MSMRDILKKIVSNKPSNEFGENEGKTSDEVELEWYKRKERLANVKKELKRYRERERNSLWKGNRMGDDYQIIKAKNVFKGNKKIFTKKGKGGDR